MNIARISFTNQWLLIIFGSGSASDPLSSRCFCTICCANQLDQSRWCLLLCRFCRGVFWHLLVQLVLYQWNLLKLRILWPWIIVWQFCRTTKIESRWPLLSIGWNNVDVVADMDRFWLVRWYLRTLWRNHYTCIDRKTKDILWYLEASLNKR